MENHCHVLFQQFPFDLECHIKIKAVHLRQRKEAKSFNDNFLFLFLTHLDTMAKRGWEKNLIIFGAKLPLTSAPVFDANKRWTNCSNCQNELIQELQIKRTIWNYVCVTIERRRIFDQFKSKTMGMITLRMRNFKFNLTFAFRQILCLLQIVVFIFWFGLI